MKTRPTLYPPVKRQLASALSYLFEHRTASSKVINFSFKNNKKWGSRDRKAFAETFYSIVRDAGLYFNQIGKSDFTHISEAEALKMIEAYEDSNCETPKLERLKFSVSSDLELILEKEMTAEEKKNFLVSSSKTAPVFLRVNLNLTDEEACIAALKEEGVGAFLLKPGCLQLANRQNVFNTKVFRKGFFEVQDGASQDVAYFMELEKGMRVADSCAGAGGKTLHMSSLLKNTGTIVAMDVFPRRLEELKKRAKRAKSQNIEIKEITGTKVVKRMEGKFDRLLLDVPCTGSGTYRRKPEAKLFFSKAEHERMLGLQKDILNLHSRLIKSGGKLVYATCSVFPSENTKQVQNFLKENLDFKLEEEVTNLVGQDGFDGFYMARLKKG